MRCIREIRTIVQAWQEFQPELHNDPSLVLTEIRSQLPGAAFISRGDTPFSLAGTPLPHLCIFQRSVSRNLAIHKLPCLKVRIK